jgi:hypothetical protein
MKVVIFQVIQLSELGEAEKDVVIVHIIKHPYTVGGWKDVIST